MKVNRNFNLDLDVAQRLQKVENASRLVNILLRDYFKEWDNNVQKEIEGVITAE